MTEPLPEVVRAIAQLRQSLEEAADALAHAHLDRLLACEARLEGALVQLPTHGLSPELRAALAPEIERCRTALGRCRRLGAALHDFVRMGLSVQGLGNEYGPRAAADAHLRTVSTTV